MDANKKPGMMQSLKNFFALGPVLGYFFRKKDPNANFNLKVMHGINKISIMMFLAALVVLVVRFFYYH